MMVAAGLIMTGGWRRVLRIQNTLFWMVTGSLLLCVVVAIFTTHSTFVHNFNNFARPYTHSGNTYAGVIAAATQGRGRYPCPVLVLSHDSDHRHPGDNRHLQLLDDVRRRRAAPGVERRKTANNMAIGGTLCLMLVAVFGFIFFRTFGHSFEVAANSGTHAGRRSRSPTRRTSS